MELNRREFIAISAGVSVAGSLPAGQSVAAQHVNPDVPWHQRVRRIGQTNMTEHDPAVMNIEEWADYWASLRVDAILISVTGILAYYPSAVPFHRHGKYLGDKDFFGECCAAARKRNMHVIARMSPDLNWEDAAQAHPEWFQLDAAGNPVKHAEDPRLYRTCMFTPYMTDYIPAIMREVNARYDIDGIFTNAWPPLGQPPRCYCKQCKAAAAPGTLGYWDRFNERTLELWRLYDSIAKEKKPDNLFLANLGGAIRCGPNSSELANVAYWFNADNQGRGGEGAPVWGASLQGRVCNAVMKGRTSTNVTGAWSTGSPRWRNIAKSPAETTMWLNQTVASGMVPWYHFIGAEDGFGADRRWEAPGRDFFTWLARNDPHFTNKRSIADIAVVMGQRTQLFYKLKGAPDTTDYVQGLYYALLDGRFFFDFIHEDDLTAENLKKYRAVLLPNTALLGDRQCQELQKYVSAGGSLLATFETSMYTERNEPRRNFGLAELFGIQRNADPATGPGNGFLARIERTHAILDGFSNTDWIPGAEFRLPIAAVENPVLTVVPPYTAYPPELSYPPIARTDEPAVVVRESGNSRLVYFPGDVDRTAWRSGNTDLMRLIQNSVRWLVNGESPVKIEGEGLVETFAWETQAGFALHVLNYTNPNAHKGWIKSFSPIGAQKVQMQAPRGRRVSRVELLKAGKNVAFTQRGEQVDFVIPRVEDYEVAALVT
ncbi:MAG TPA: alpha-amylase family protein [Candidatus Aquilonibacter sp.]|nr:alpha-amylase family protein [Candidatus Aquilonibacter sp.]